MTNGMGWEAATSAPSAPSCTVPLTVRLIGRPTDGDLTKMEDVIADAVARRLSTAHRTLGSLHGRRPAVLGRRPPAKKTKKHVPLRRPHRHAARPSKRVDSRDRAEFELFKVDPGTGIRVRRPKITPETVEGYLRLRRRIFKGDPAHPDEAYRAFARESDAELAAHPRLRGVLEYGHSPKTQTVFYRWVRKAFIDWVRSEHLDPGIAEDIPGVIVRASRRAESLKDLVNREGRLAYGKKGWAAMHLSVQGFNPRPEKGGGRFILGTLSQHAFGAAVDIDPDHNPQLSAAQWRWIETVVGRSIDRKASRWRDDPRDLWQDIKDLNDDFVKEIDRRITAEETRRSLEAWASRHPLIGGLRAPGREPPHLRLELHEWVTRSTAPPSIDVVFHDHPELKQYRAGFFHLGWELVGRLHDQGLLWGATFDRVDLHHFELPAAMATIEAEESLFAQVARALRLRLPEPDISAPLPKPPIHIIDPLRLDPTLLPPDLSK